MFESIKETLKKTSEDRAKSKEEADRAARRRDAEEAAKARAAAAREAKIASIRVITGEVKYPYAILDTLRTYAHYMAEPGQSYDPTISSSQATRMMQELAFNAGADAVIHAQYNIVRYTTARRGYVDVPVYETHLFGTAIKIMGPPVDWPVDAK